MTTFNVLSPDGISIEMDAEYKSKKLALSSLKRFIERYQRQGYYNSSSHGRIPVEMIICYCKLQKFKNGELISTEDLD